MILDHFDMYIYELDTRNPEGGLLREKNLSGYITAFLNKERFLKRFVYIISRHYAKLLKPVNTRMYFL